MSDTPATAKNGKTGKQKAAKSTKTTKAAASKPDSPDPAPTPTAATKGQLAAKGAPIAASTSAASTVTSAIDAGSMPRDASDASSSSAPIAASTKPNSPNLAPTPTAATKGRLAAKDAPVTALSNPNSPDPAPTPTAATKGRPAAKSAPIAASSSTTSTVTSALDPTPNPRGASGNSLNPSSPAAPTTPLRLAVRKTYKLFIGGAFPRSESGRSYQVTSTHGTFLANAALASRKDARDAVKAARAAFGGWSGATAYNRGQILYRIAEMLEGRRDQFAAEVSAVDGIPIGDAGTQVDAAIDRWVWYAGWSDKLSQVRGTVNPVAGPYWNVSSPEPTGVVAVFAPEHPSLLGLVSVLAPVIVSGNTAVLVAPDSAAVPAITLAEVLATSDLPGGVVNILTGRIAELGKPLADHLDVDALDLTGVPDLGLATDLERAGAQNLKRIRRPIPDPGWSADPGLDRMVSFLEVKTVWHPVGA